MAIYSSELENVLAKLIINAKMVLEICASSRENLKVAFSEGTRWRDYSKEVLSLFEMINRLERATLWVIEKSDVIRRKNDACAGNDFSQGGDCDVADKRGDKENTVCSA